MTSMKPKDSLRCDDENDVQRLEEVARLNTGVSEINDHPGWSPWRRTAFSILHSLPFELAVGVVTLLNLVVVVIETNERAECRSAGHSDDDCNEGVVLRMLNFGCLLIYVAEISFRLWVDQMKFLKSRWNCSDVIIVCLSGVAEVFNSVLPSLGFLRMFRILRLFRTVRILTIQRELYMLVHGFLSTMKALFWAAILMLGLLTMWSILAVEVLHPINLDVASYSDAYEDCSRCSRSFASVWDANLTFFNTVVLGDGWADFILPVVDRQYWTLAIFMGVSFSVGLGLVNLILAVIVDRAREAHEEDVNHQTNVKQQKMANAKKTMSKMFATMDADQSGTLSLQELIAGYEDSPMLRQMFSVLDVERDDIECVFKILDADDSGDVSYQEFIDNLYRMKAHNSRTLLVFIKFYVTELRRNVQEELTLIKGDILGTLKNHTNLLSNLKLSAPTGTNSFSKPLAHQEISQKKKDGAKEVVKCANLEEVKWPPSNGAAPVLHPYTMQDKERCSNNPMPSDDLLRTLARADSLHEEVVAGMCLSGESETEGPVLASSEVMPFSNKLMPSDDLLGSMARADGLHKEVVAEMCRSGEAETEEPVLASSEVMPFHATVGLESQVNSSDAVTGRGLSRNRAPESLRQSLPGQFQCEGTQSTSPPPEAGTEFDRCEVISLGSNEPTK